MNRSGAVLIEVIAAIAILSVSGLSLVRFLTSVQEAQFRLEEREMEMRRAERLITATALLNEAELEQRIGVRQVDDMLLWIDRPEPSLFRVGVSRSEQPEVELLATLLYRRRTEADES